MAAFDKTYVGYGSTPDPAYHNIVSKVFVGVVFYFN